MLLEQILGRKNLIQAFERVNQNKGCAGVDGMEIEDLAVHLKENWKEIRQSILDEKYTPMPVRKVEIPKTNGEMRQLGIPTLLDRLIQQAIAQVLSPIYEKKFSDSSYGFRPERSAHCALRQSKKFVENGCKYVVDIDLENFFDTVNHDKLMKRLWWDLGDRNKRLLRLIRKYLRAGIMENGLKVKTKIGTPQGGPLSPLLSNIVLDQLDKELEKRGHKFCRYADDCNIYVKSERAGGRVMESITKYIEGKLKLKINQGKSSVSSVGKIKFLGFNIANIFGRVRILISAKSKWRFKQRVVELTQRNCGVSLETTVQRIDSYVIGWFGYYSLAEMKKFVEKEDARLRRRMRMCIWKQWKKVKARYRNLKLLGLDHKSAIKYANTRKGYWRVSNSQMLSTTLTNEYLFEKVGLISMTDVYLSFRSS